MDETEPKEPTDQPSPTRPGGQPPSFNLAAVAGGIVLIGLLAFSLYRRGTPAPTGAPADAAHPEAAQKGAAPGDTPPPPGGGVITQVVPVRMSPEASIVAERFRCVCGCNESLGACTCNKTPGSNEMKTFLQQQVDQKKGGTEIDQAMIEKWGPQALLTAAPAAPKPAPTKR